MEMNLEDLFRFHDEERYNVSEYDNYFIIEEERVGKKYRVDLGKYSDYDYDVLTSNTKLKYFEKNGICFGDYVEFLINYDEHLFNGVTEMDEFIMKKFKIGEVCIEIGHPTLLFDLVSRYLDGDKYYDNVDFWTISLKGVTVDNYEEYLVKAHFLLKYYNESPFEEWNPTCYAFLGYYDATMWPEENDETIIKNRRNEIDDFEKMEFEDLLHYEAISFYNEGFRLNGHEVSFHYFYKVLEYFFLICREDIFKEYIEDYNIEKNMMDFIKKVTSVYKQSEEMQLKNLLGSIEAQIVGLISEAVEQEIIHKATVEDYSYALYQYRNAIVHGKSDERFFVKIPTTIKNNKEKYWSKSIQVIAEILIRKYCFKNSKIIKPY